MNRFGWQNGKLRFTAPGPTIGSNPVKIVRTGSNRFVASPSAPYLGPRGNGLELLDRQFETNTLAPMSAYSSTRFPPVDT